MSAPEPGIYYDIPFEEYLTWEAVSSSRLKLADKSLAHYQRGWVGTETAAIKMGSLVHAGKLEPLSIAARYAVMPDYENDAENLVKKGKVMVRSTSKSSTYYKAKRAEFEKANPDRVIVTQSEYDRMVAIVTSLHQNAQVMHCIGGRGPVEVSMVWVDDETGLACKGRIDKLKQHLGLFGDLKTDRDVQKFDRHIVDRGYQIQAAFYQSGYMALAGEVLTPWLAAVEKEDPFGCAAAPIDEALIEKGHGHMRRLLRAVAEANETGEFPSYENPDSWVGPDWYSGEKKRGPVEVTIGGKKVTI